MLTLLIMTGLMCPLSIFLLCSNCSWTSNQRLLHCYLELLDFRAFCEALKASFDSDNLRWLPTVHYMIIVSIAGDSKTTVILMIRPTKQKHDETLMICRPMHDSGFPVKVFTFSSPPPSSIATFPNVVAIVVYEM